MALNGTPGRKTGSHYGPVDLVRAWEFTDLVKRGMTRAEVGLKFGVSRQWVGMTVEQFRRFSEEHTELLGRLVHEEPSKELCREAAARILQLHQAVVIHGEREIQEKGLG